MYPLKDIIKGQDQVVDIELDKDTVIRAPRRDYTPVESRSLWNQQFESMPVTVSLKTDPSDDPTESKRPGPVCKFIQSDLPLSQSTKKDLLRSWNTFPWQSKVCTNRAEIYVLSQYSDFKGRRTKLAKVPYMLASSVQHFSSFVTGRRKTIEVGQLLLWHIVSDLIPPF